jgi:hypothetical protein
LTEFFSKCICWKIAFDGVGSFLETGDFVPFFGLAVLKWQCASKTEELSLVEYGISSIHGRLTGGFGGYLRQSQTTRVNRPI